MNAVLAAMTAVVFLAVSANVHASKEDRVVNEIGVIGGILDSGYAPAEWKKDLFGWDLGSEVAKAQSAVRAKSATTTRDYQKIARNLLRTSQDYHVGYNFDRTEAATLPFSIKSAEGKYIIVHIDRKQLSTSYPVQVGDELVSIDGQETNEIVKEMIAEIGQGVKETDQALAEIAVTNRRASKAMDVPNGRVMITVRNKDTQQLRSFQIQWTYTPELVRFQDEIATFTTNTVVESPNAKVKRAIKYIKSMKMAKGDFAISSEEHAEENEGEDAPTEEETVERVVNGNPYTIGSRDSFLPELGKKIWEPGSDDHMLMHIFQAYIYENNGKKIGYLRIPSYMGSTFHFVGFLMLVEKFQKETDGLVIDQLNNPGGSVFYLYALASLLTDQPIKTPQHRIKINTRDVLMAQTVLKFLPEIKDDLTAQMVLGPDWDGYPMNYQTLQFIIEYFRFIVSEWEAGKELSDPVHLYGVDQINPSSFTTYDKPIVILVNELDFSGGDFFPAILQDNGRAKVMGVRTAGAGGFVLRASYPNSIGLNSFSYTGSLAVRPTGSPLENLGVTPDIDREFTLNDLRNGFVDYIGAVNAEIDKITVKTVAPTTPAVPAPAAN